jgi:hypothetical protein
MVLSRPTHQWVTQTVETVEKATFQKLFLKSGKETLKSACFWVFFTTFWQFFSLLWEIFFEHFSNQGFFDSLVRRLLHKRQSK